MMELEVREPEIQRERERFWLGFEGTNYAAGF